jgi:Ankyrin repeats (3 copies)
MIMGLAIQAVMGPFNLWENILVRTLVLRGTKAFTDESQSIRIFDEKVSLHELDASTDEVVDDKGNPIVIRNTNNTNNRNAIRNNRTTTSTETTAITTTTNDSTAALSSTTPKSLEDVMLDTWDQGSNASLTELLSMLTTSNVNTTTTEDGWTSLMIVSGLKCDKDTDAIRTLINDLKASITITDNDGWTCLHWAAFHNSLSAAVELYRHSALLSMQDNEGKTPLEIAQQEKNTGVADMLQVVMTETKKDK